MPFHNPIWKYMVKVLQELKKTRPMIFSYKKSFLIRMSSLSIIKVNNNQEVRYFM